VGNTLAYYDMATITAVKSFIVQAPGSWTRTRVFIINDSQFLNREFESGKEKMAGKLPPFFQGQDVDVAREGLHVDPAELLLGGDRQPEFNVIHLFSLRH